MKRILFGSVFYHDIGYTSSIVFFSSWVKAIILGLIEGMTEFIPVSSTGHLILFGEWLSFSIDAVRSFDITIQLGAILAVLVYYRDIFLGILKDPRAPLFRNLVVTTIPALGIGAIVHRYLDAIFNPVSVAFGLGIGGVIMMIVDKTQRKMVVTSLDELSMKQAFWVGCAQCLAMWPGVSRSGATIVGGLLCRMDYTVAATYSFLAAVPVMIAAVGYDLLTSAEHISQHEWGLIAVGFGVSFVTALVAIRFFLAALRRYRLFPFAVYRVVLSVMILLSFVF